MEAKGATDTPSDPVATSDFGNSMRASPCPQARAAWLAGERANLVNLGSRPLGMRSARILTAAYGAPRPLRRIPAIVSFLNPKPALSLGVGNRASCPTPAIHDRRRGGSKPRSTERRLNLLR